MNGPVKILLKKLALFSVPFLILVSMYVYWDPFKVIYQYASYMSSYKKGVVRSASDIVSLNKDMVSTRNYMNKKDEQCYDSFILGSSRSMFYEISKWKKCVKSERCYHFDASAETLYGVGKKVELMDQQNTDIKNVLFILDRTLLAVTSNSKGQLYIKDPLLSGQNGFGYHLNFFKAFLSFKFFSAYIDYNLNKELKPYMHFILEDRPFTYDPITNECTLEEFEQNIQEDQVGYYSPKMRMFYKRSSVQAYSEPVIFEEQMKYLKTIKAIFDKKKSSYKIVVSPLYDQIGLNKKDLDILKEIFGETNVFDFSGKNRFTEDYHNYYESSHYRPFVADMIMDSVYFSDKKIINTIP